VIEHILGGNEEIESRVHALELYATLREYLLVERILRALGADLNDKARYVLEALSQELLNRIQYHAEKGGLEEATIIDLALLSWDQINKPQAESSAPTIKEVRQ